MPDIGIIAIGRNEGGRLKRCLASVVGRGMPVVYVDSASTDGSPAAARDAGAEVVDLDMSKPFSAARARNEGMARLLAVAPDVRYVQMVDGDCEVVATWIERAKSELESKPQAAVVCGRRRERFPEASIYNAIADVEWNSPVGEAKSCGGDAMFRVDAFQQAGGYDNSVVAGEEPELCQRLREKGWKVYRVDAEMTVHDAAMFRFGQWWKRSVRSGYGAMDVATRFRKGNDGLFVKQVRSAWTWTTASLFLLLIWVMIPLANFVGSRVLPGGSPTVLSYASFIGVPLFILLYALAVAVQVARIARGARRRAPSWRVAVAYGVLTMIGKWANAAGQIRYNRDRKAGRLTRMIDYKGAGTPAAS